MPPSRADYLAPWWAAWLHGVPHRDLRLQPVPAAFRPRDPEYQQSLLFLGLVAAVCLGLNLLFLTSYLLCLCCCKRDEEPDTKRPHACCVTWMAVTAGLICCTAVGIGFYGNSETNDGVYQLLYALDNANHTLTGIDTLVAGSTQRLQGGLEQHLGRLSEVLAPRADYLQTLKFLQQLAAGVVLQLSGLPSWHGVSAQLTALAARAAYVEYYRWLAYLLFFILVLTVCLLGCLGLAKRSRCLLAVMLCCGLLTLVLSWASTALDAAAAVGTSDFCVAPDKFIMNQTESEISAEVAHYYLYCEQSLSNPFQQALTVFQRSLTTMQIQTQGLIQFALPLFPTAEKDLLGVQQLLNASETSLHQLTPMLDCRGLHKDYLDALIGICYDGVEGLLYLVLFSLLVAASFSTIICATPRAWKHLAGRDRDYDDMDEEDPFNPQARRIAAHNPARGQLRSFCSYSSSLGSQSSLHPPTQTISNAPISEYMNQAVLFGGNPRYENVPLIGRGSPPPRTPRACEPPTCPSPMSTSGPSTPSSQPSAGPEPLLGAEEAPGAPVTETKDPRLPAPRVRGSPPGEADESLADGAPQAPLSSLGSFCWLSRLPACLTGRVPALTAGLRPAAGLLLRLQGWGWVVPTAFSPFPPVPALGFSCHGWGPRFGFLLFFSGGERAGPWAACPACSFTPVAMQTQPLVIPTPSPPSPLLPPGPGFGVWDGDGFGLAVFPVLRVWVLRVTRRAEVWCGSLPLLQLGFPAAHSGRRCSAGLWAFLDSSASWGRLPSLVQDGSGVTTTPSERFRDYSGIPRARFSPAAGCAKRGRDIPTVLPGIDRAWG